MTPKELTDWLYNEVEDQHEIVDEIQLAIDRYNPVQVGRGIGNFINNQHEMKGRVISGIHKGDFKGFVEYVSKIYLNGTLYKACASFSILPQISFSRGFVCEARGTLYYLTALLTTGIINMEGDNKKHYITSALGSATKSLEEAIELSNDTVLARGLLKGLEKYKQVSTS